MKEVSVKNVPLGHPKVSLSGSHMSSVGRTKILSHAILATTNRGSKIILLLGIFAPIQFR